MPERRKSYQQLDPIGGWEAHPLTVVCGVALVGYAAIATVAGWSQVDHPAIAVGAVASTAGAAAVLAYWSSPYRAPFPTAAFLAVLGFGTLAMVLAAVASWEGNTGVRDDWAPLALGILLLLLGWYRPARQLAVAAALVAVAAGDLALLQAEALSSEEPALVMGVTAGAPPLAIALAGASYAAVRARLAVNWQSRTRSATDALGHQLKDGILRSVQEDRITILNRDVVPFLSRLLAEGEIGPEEKRAAARIADSIRALMVAEVDRTWLEVEVERAGRSRFGEAWADKLPVVDADRVASAMSTDQRTITRALMVALFEYEGFDPSAFRLTLSRQDAVCTVVLTAKLDSDESLQRSELAMYVAVMRVVFLRQHLVSEPPMLTLKFSYEQ